MGINSLLKTVATQRHDCDLNTGPSAPEFSTLTSRLSIHLELSRGKVGKMSRGKYLSAVVCEQLECVNNSEQFS